MLVDKIRSFVSELREEADDCIGIVGHALEKAADNLESLLPATPDAEDVSRIYAIKQLEKAVEYLATKQDACARDAISRALDQI